MQQAMSHATEEDREILRSTHLDSTLSADEKIARVKAVYEKYDVPHAIQRMISTRFERAIAILDTLDLDSAHTEYLRIYAENLMNRKK